MTWSESVYLDAVSADGSTGFVTRLARHVDEGATWLWLHAFLPESRVAFVRDDLPCSTDRTDVDGDPACYRVDSAEASARFERLGPRHAPSGAAVHVSIGGPDPLTLDATFAPDGPAGSNLPGRTECLGLVDATLTTPRGAHRLSARGQLHEQHQDAPRFTVPFTYGTLRGEQVGSVFLIGPARSGGFVRRGSAVERATSVVIDPVGDTRALRLVLEGGDEVVIDVRATHRYALPIGGRDRDSSIVRATVGDDVLSGCINDWQPV